MDVIIRCVQCSEEFNNFVATFFSLTDAIRHIVENNYRHEVIIEVKEPESDD